MRPLGSRGALARRGGGEWLNDDCGRSLVSVEVLVEEEAGGNFADTSMRILPPKQPQRPRIPNNSEKFAPGGTGNDHVAAEGSPWPSRAGPRSPNGRENFLAERRIRSAERRRAVRARPHELATDSAHKTNLERLLAAPISACVKGRLKKFSHLLALVVNTAPHAARAHPGRFGCSVHRQLRPMPLPRSMWRLRSRRAGPLPCRALPMGSATGAPTAFLSAPKLATD